MLGGMGVDQTVAQLWASYERFALSRLSPYTRTGYRRIWRLRVEPHLGSLSVSALTVAIVEDWLAELHISGLSWNTCRNAKVTLGAMLTFAARRDEGVTLPHVAQRAQVPGEEPVGHIEVPDPTIVAAVIQDLVATDLQLACFERIAAVTGARRGEIGALRVEDVFKDGLMFDEAVRMDHPAGVAILSIGPTKTKQRRFVECDDLTLATIEAWALEANITEPRALLFAAPGGGPVHPERWSHRWRRACARHGIVTHQHALRHLVGTLTAESLGLRVAQERLGHARVGTTQRYAKVRGAQGMAAADVMAGALLINT